jgi:hypothetical protein
MNIDEQIVRVAPQDLQRWMATAGRDTTEASINAWQAGYIAGVQRALSIQQESITEEI